jgi:hypothetical protein
MTLASSRTAIALLLAGACATARAQAPPPPIAAIPTAPAAAAHTDLDQAIAGPLVVALSDQFGGRHVELRLKTLHAGAMPDGAGIVHGTGLVRVQGQPGEVGFGFRIPWNAQLRSAGYPEISLGGAVAGERQLPNDTGLVRQLEADITAALAHHMRQPTTSVRLDRIATVEAGPRLLRISAAGVAYADRGGPGMALTILALYDRTRRAWMRLEYGLGEEAAALVSR